MSMTIPVSSLDQQWVVDVFVGSGEDRQRCEDEMVQAGVRIPLPHRIAWAKLGCAAESCFFGIRDGSGRYRAGFAAEVNPSRALPGHLLLRVERFGGICGPACRAGLDALSEMARTDARVLRVNVQTYSPDAAERASMADLLQQLDFQPVRPLRSYARTILMDLGPDEAKLFSSLHRSARANVKAVGKQPICLRTIDDVLLQDRLAELHRETQARTGGHYDEPDWGRRIELSMQYPDLARLVGLFRAEGGGPEALLAFASACHHGDHAHYDAAASTRCLDRRVPLAYALLWDLICWAKRNGARWFDFGGVTPGHSGDPDDPLGGISDFKRSFCTNMVEVGDEWMLEPRPLRARVARFMSKGANWLGVSAV